MHFGCFFLSSIVRYAHLLVLTFEVAMGCKQISVALHPHLNADKPATMVGQLNVPKRIACSMCFMLICITLIYSLHMYT